MERGGSRRDELIIRTGVDVSSEFTEKQNPRDLRHEGFDKAGDNLLSRYSHYHGPQVLNGRVRNGNGCVHLGMVTGKTHGVRRVFV